MKTFCDVNSPVYSFRCIELSEVPTRGQAWAEQPAGPQRMTVAWRHLGFGEFNLWKEGYRREHHWLQDSESRAPGRRGFLKRPQGVELQAPPEEMRSVLGCQAKGSDHCPSTASNDLKQRGSTRSWF